MAGMGQPSFAFSGKRICDPFCGVVEKEVDSLQEECLCAAPCVLQRRFVGELFPLDIRFALLLARIVLKALAVMESSLHNEIWSSPPSDVT